MNCHLMSGKNKGSKRTDELNFIFDNAFKNDAKNRVSYARSLYLAEILHRESLNGVYLWRSKLSNQSA